MTVTSPRGQLMKSYLPPLYERSRVMDALLQAEGQEFDALREALDEVLDQCFVRTATWGLDRWEDELGLAPAPEPPEAERRDRLVSRLRGTGTATIRVVKEVAEAYDQGEIDVAENHGAYTIIVTFVDTRGVPPNLDDLKAAVRAVVPAHLDVQYAFNYTIWTEVDARAWTWDQMDGAAPGGPGELIGKPGQPVTWDDWDILL